MISSQKMVAPTALYKLLEPKKSTTEPAIPKEQASAKIFKNRPKKTSKKKEIIKLLQWRNGNLKKSNKTSSKNDIVNNIQCEKENLNGSSKSPVLNPSSWTKKKMNVSKSPEKSESVCVMEDEPYVGSAEDKPEVRQSTIARLLLSNRMTRSEVGGDVLSTAEEGGLSEVPTITLDGDSSQDQQYVVNYHEASSGRSDFESGRSEYDLTHQGDLSPLDEYNEDRSSPENLVTPTGFSIAARLYKCRFCNFSTMKYTQLQLHMPKHGGVKALKCSLCDYSTNDKSNFRRHKRLHLRNNPVNVLKCDKCTYSTILPRKIREHYCEEHKEVPNSTATDPSISYSGPTYGETRFSFRHFGVDQNNSTSNPLGVSTLHTLLTTVQSPNLQFRRSGQTPLSNCFSQYNHYESAGQQANPDSHLASNYLRSIVSSIINSPPPPPPPPAPLPQPRVPVTSTITSSGLYSTAAVSSVAPALPSAAALPLMSLPGPSVAANEMDATTEVKVKVEPYECEEISDVSSSAAATPMRTVTPDCTRDLQTSLSTSQRQALEYEASPSAHFTSEIGQLTEGGQTNLNLVESSNTRLDYHSNVDENSVLPDDLGSSSLLKPYGESPLHPSSSSTTKNPNGESSSSCVTNRNGICDNGSVRKSFSQEDANSSSVKTETSSVAVQCVLPSVKTESCSSGQQETPERKRWRHQFTERAVQCELLPSRRTGSRSMSLASESEGSEQPSNATMTDNRCVHCGVTFEDEVLFSIHIGCHSHTDPFVCNVCGKHCCNKYGFYSHIMRGHQY